MGNEANAEHPPAAMVRLNRKDRLDFLQASTKRGLTPRFVGIEIGRFRDGEPPSCTVSQLTPLLKKTPGPVPGALFIPKNGQSTKNLEPILDISGRFA